MAQGDIVRITVALLISNPMKKISVYQQNGIYQVYKYETGNFFEKIHVYLIKMVIHSIFKVMAIASHTFFPSL